MGVLGWEYNPDPSLCDYCIHDGEYWSRDAKEIEIEHRDYHTTMIMMVDVANELIGSINKKAGRVMSNYLSRSAILNADDIKYEDVPTPEWGNGTCVRVKSLTADERDALEAHMYQIKNDKLITQLEDYLRNFRSKLVVRCVVDEDGRRIFSDDDANKLGVKNAAVVDRIADIARKLCGLRKEDMEEMGKDLGTPQQEDSHSDLRENSDTQT